MVKTKEIKRTPDLRFSEFEGEWKQLALGQIAKFRNGKAHEQEIEETGQFIVVNSKFISTEGDVKKYANRLICPLKKSEVVMVMSDIPRGKALAKCYYIEQGERYTLNQRICGLYSTNYSNKFLFYRLNRHPYFLKFDSGVGQTNLRKDEIKHCPLNIPESTIEQEKIASFLSAVDKKIQQLTAKKELLEQYKKGVMQKIFSQEIRFTDENGKDYPDWQEKKLGDLGCINPRTPELPDKFVYIDLESVAKGRLLKEEIVFSRDAPSRAQRVMRKGDILFQMVRPYQKNNLFFNFEGDYVASTGYAQIRAKEDSMFFYQLLHNQPLVNLVIRSSTGSNYPAINSTDLNVIPIIVPSITEQEKIGAFLQNIDKKIESVQSQLIQTQTFKKGLLQQMFV